MAITIVCVPYQLDMAVWGYAQGPLAWLEAGVTETLVQLGHRLRPRTVWIDLARAERTTDTVVNLSRIAAQVAAAVRDGLREPADRVLVLEGDCSHAVGAIGGLALAVGASPGVAWFDAHGDLHTMATTLSGYIGGMPYAVALGWEFAAWREAAGLIAPVRPEAAALIGVCDLDPSEDEIVGEQPLTVISAADMARFDGAIAGNVTARLAPLASQASAWYLHVDVDVFGAAVVPGGLTPAASTADRDALLTAISATAQLLPPRVVSLATYNPAGDPARVGARIGQSIIEAAFGGR